MTGNPAQKILVIRFSSIGDIVLTTPVIRCLKNQTNAEIHFLTKSSFVSLITPNPHITKVWSLDEEMGELIKKLKAEDFDFVVDLHKNLRSFRTRLGLKTNGKSFPKINLEKWLMVNLKIDRLPDKHIVDRYFEAVTPLGVSYDQKGLEHHFPKGIKLKTPSNWQEGIPENLVCIALGGAHETKRLPFEKMAILCQNIPNPIVLIGGPSEKAAGEKLESLNPDKIWNQCGKVNLHESAAWIRESCLLVTHDTGMMHIGAALSRKIVSIWGNTIPGFGMYPFYPEGEAKAQIAEVPGLSCRPCSKIGYDRCPKGHFRCMMDQDLDQILDWVEKGTKDC
ncbi:MAG: glycosyltransferase family 9 protein [Bacteroidetes bacterium]|nr:glycosyltransferase family 9 protein [Bacteroidota bacterium]